MAVVDVRALRVARGWTQAACAQVLQVHRCTVSRWECGRHRPRPVHAARLQAYQDNTVPTQAPAEMSRTRALAALASLAPARTAAHDERWRLYQADLFDVLPTLEGDSFDGLIGDLPYSSGGLHVGTRQQAPSRKYQSHRVNHKRADFDGDQRDQLSWMHWSTEVLRRCYRVLKRSAVVALFIDHRQLAPLIIALQSAGFAYRGVATWDKSEAARPVPGRFRHQCEFIVWGSKGDLPIDRDVPILPGCFREPVRAADKHHLTGKPTAVMRWLTQFVIPGGRILDPSAGSGTTGVAALLEGRHFVGIEQDAHTARIATARLRAAARGRLLAPAEAQQEAASG